jgi:hypothetical protein
MKKDSKSRFPLILLGSMALHVAALAAFYGSWLYGAALKFGTLSFDDSGSPNHYKVMMVDRTAPLYLPKGFYAVEKPPEVVEKPKPKQEAKKKDEKKVEEPEPKEPQDDVAKAEEPKKEEPPPAQPGNFGKIGSGALKPHIQRVYTAYEAGQIPLDTFTVTVTCRAMPDGSLADIRLVKRSGNQLIDGTALNLFREVSDMKALAPLSKLSSLSLTLDVGPSSSELSAVGFADDPSDTNEMATQLSSLATLARFTSKNTDQTTLINNIKIASSGNRLSVRLDLPNSVAGDMMRRSFGARNTAQAGT